MFNFDKMTCVGFLSFLGLIVCCLTECEGSIVSPAEGTEVTFISGSTGNITWKFDDDISSLFTRAWHFTRRGGSKEELLATISDDDPRKIRTNSLLGVEIEKPATLLLKNVNQSYNGQYRFSLTTKSASVPETIGVNVFIAKRPTVTLNCSHSSPIVLNEAKPIIKSFTSNPDQPVNGKPVTLTCESDGVPEPDYVIKFENGSVASTVKTFEIAEMGSSYNGEYTCIAKNIKGNDSAVLNVTGQAKAPSKECNCAGKTEWYIVMVSLFSGVIIGSLLSYIILSFRRKFGSKNTQSNPEPQTTGVDPTYQELDLTKMNKEDNYQSLRANAASNDVANDDDSTYTELNQVRDVENNYQSLT